jgi:hypothetical protein
MSLKIADDILRRDASKPSSMSGSKLPFHVLGHGLRALGAGRKLYFKTDALGLLQE